MRTFIAEERQQIKSAGDFSRNRLRCRSTTHIPSDTKPAYMMAPRVLIDGLHFPECPRWRGDQLWFSDMHGHCVMRADLAGRAEVVGQLPTQPAGLGWTPDGRPWAELSDAVPDGICLDAEGAVWIANVIGREAVRVAAGGTITRRVPVSNHAFACMLGGPDRRTLFVLTADNSSPEYCREHTAGKIEMFTVDVPGFRNRSLQPGPSRTPSPSPLLSSARTVGVKRRAKRC